jgi:hypothetical protein
VVCLKVGRPEIVSLGISSGIWKVKGREPDDEVERFVLVN